MSKSLPRPSVEDDKLKNNLRQQRFAEIAAAEKALADASEQEAEPTPAEKWAKIVTILDAYAGRYNKDGSPNTNDLEKALDRDLTPEIKDKIWSKYQSQKSAA